jgi:hypothetical protein
MNNRLFVFFNPQADLLNIIQSYLGTVTAPEFNGRRTTKYNGTGAEKKTKKGFYRASGSQTVQTF